MPKAIQFVHDPSIKTENLITAFVHCGKCLDERPQDISPKDWARTQTGYTRDGFQVWCTRHDVNIDSVTVQLAPAQAASSTEDTSVAPKPPRGLDQSWVLSGTRGWIGLVSCQTDLVSWLQFKFSCSRAVATKAAAWAQYELKRLGEPYERAA